MTEDDTGGEAIPAYLFLPPSAAIAQPSVARLQELPFYDLSWQDFERLCLRLAQSDGDTVKCNRYGTVGQKQHGIDLYARLAREHSYAVYQCKHYRNIKAGDIKKAANTFLQGPWVSRARRLILCTTASSESTRVLDEVERQAAILRNAGIEFDVWGRSQLSERLKAMPVAVDDFFGRSWVELFCGKEVASSLASRVDGPRLVALRGQLGAFYRRIFAQHDPGLPAMGVEQQPPPGLERRYVIPDVLVSFRPPVVLSHAQEALPLAEGNILSREAGVKEPRQVASRPLDSFGHQRMPVEQWLQSGERLMIVGPPGAGKSTLLRFLALDLLADEPRLGTYARAQPGCIPIWVPFAHWTEMLEQRPIEEWSVLNFLRSWFASWGATELIPLLELALTDGRLLLLIDGIDEWRSRESAGQALHRLVEFVAKRTVPVICSSRPYGIERAGTIGPDFREAQLAPLTGRQQKTLATTWLEYWIGGGSVDASVTRQAQIGADTFTADLVAVSDLTSLAQNPLLLMLLARLWLQETTLPADRFSAYGRIVDHLCREHPRRRAVAASMSGRHFRIDAADVRQQLAFIAFSMHQRHAYAEERDVLRAHLLAYLKSEGFSAEGARQWADSVLGQAPDAPPILVNVSDTKIGFIHRALLEHMAAIWILGLAFEEQKTLVQTHLADERWSEVLLSVMHGARRNEINEFLGIVESAVDSEPLSTAPRILLAELAFGPFKVALPVAARAAEQTFYYIEFGSSTMMRQRLVSIAIRGARSDRISSVLSERIKSWFPGGRGWLPSVYAALSRFEPRQDLEEALFGALNSEHELSQRAAAEAIAGRWSGEPRIAMRLLTVIGTPNRPTTQASSLLALHVGWTDHDALKELSLSGVNSPSDIIRLACHVIRVARSWHVNTDADDLVGMLSSRGGVPYGWKDLAIDTLAKGWAESEEVHSLIRQGVSRHVLTAFDRHASWQLAAKVMRGDEAIAVEIGQVLRRDQDYRAHDDKFWDAVENGYLEMPEVRTEVESWILRQTWSPNYIYRAARQLRSPSVKAFLIKQIRSRPNAYDFWLVAALVEAWSLGDPEVLELVHALALGDAAGAANVAQYIPTILGEAALGRLVSLLEDPACPRRDFVMRAVASLGKNVDLPRVVDAFFSRELSRPDFAETGALRVLLSLGSDDPRVRKRAELEIEEGGDELSAAIEGYGDRLELRERILRRCRPVASDVRRAVVEGLSRLPEDVPLVAETLQYYAAELDAATRAQAVYSYCVGRRRTGAVELNELTRRLSTEAASYGLHHELVRQAAACGLLALERLDTLTEARETIGGGELVTLPLKGSFSVNAVLAEQLMKSWDYVEALWGDQAWRRFLKLRSSADDELAFWIPLMSWIAPGTRAEERLGQLIEESTRQLPPGALAFLARDSRNSSKLLDQCLKYLGLRGGVVADDLVVLADVTDILARIYGGDEGVLGELKRHVKDDVPSTGIVVALCKGWPNVDWLDAIVRTVASDEMDLEEMALVELRCAKGDAASVLRTISQLVAARVQHPIFQQHYLASILRRGQRDPAVRDALLGVLKNDADLSRQVAAARVVASTSPRSADVHAWASKVVVDVRTETIWPSAYDLGTGRVRCVQSIIWDLISG